jgi:hypothetical protein
MFRFAQHDSAICEMSSNFFGAIRRVWRTHQFQKEIGSSDSALHSISQVFASFRVIRGQNSLRSLRCLLLKKNVSASRASRVSRMCSPDCLHFFLAVMDPASLTTGFGVFGDPSKSYASSTAMRWRSSSSISAGVATVWAISSRNND